MAAPKSYDPSARDNAMVTNYYVNTDGDRWFIPYNDNDTKAEQVAQCSKIVGNTADGSVAGARVVAGQPSQYKDPLSKGGMNSVTGLLAPTTASMWGGSVSL